MLKRMLEQLSIKKKIQSIIFLCIFFVSLTSLVCFHFISKAYEKSLYQSVSNSLSYSSENILERINNINMLSDLILSDQTIQDYLTRIQNSSSASELSINYELIYRKLINYLFNFNSNNIMNISIIINPELTVSTSTYKQQYLTAQVRDSIVQNALKEDGTAVWITDFCDDYGLFLSRELKRTYALDLDTLGVLVISVNSAAMTEDAISYHSAADNGYLLMNQGHVIYKSPKLSEDDVSLLKTFDQGYQIITAIEKFEPRIIKAKENIEKAGKTEIITLLEGDALEILKELKPSYDFIFMDAAKGQYIHFLPEVLRLLAPGGTLVSDNVLQDGDIVQSRYAVTRRNRTIHSRMREYLWELKHNEALETVILPVGDGMTISTKL